MQNQALNFFDIMPMAGPIDLFIGSGVRPDLDRGVRLKHFEGAFHVSLDKAPEDSHEERRTDPFVTDFGNNNANVPLVNRKPIIKISRNLFGRMETCLNFPAGNIQHSLGQKRPLHVSAFFQLGAESLR